MLPVLVFALSLGFAIVMAAMLACDELVRIERDLAPGQWESDGMPAPMLKQSTGSSVTVAGMLATTRCCMAWMLSTPAWARENVRASRLLTRLRMLLILWTFVAVPLFALTVSAPVA